MKVQIAAQLLTLNFLRSIIAVSKLSTLRLHFAHLRFAEPSSSFNVISNRALILHDASLSWLSFLFTKQYYMVAIATEDSQRRHTDAILTNWADINFVSEPAPK